MAKIAILTTFMKFDPWYSLTGIVKDQCRMLTEYGNEVFLFVNEQFNDQSNQFTDPNIHLLKKIPFAHLHDYQSEEPLLVEHEATARTTTEMLVNSIKELGIDTVFTHDLVFTGWSMPYAIGIQRIKNQLPGVVWMHWIHSIPSRYSDWWQMSEYGPNHKLIYPNATDKIRVAESYRTQTSSVRTIPHIKDLRIMFNFSEETCELIDNFPALMQADVVQIYPASSDRFESKRVAEVIKIMAAIKSCGHSVCLFIANQWATTQKHYANLMEFYDLGKKYGLEPGKHLIFSSLFADADKTPYKVGVPANILTQLMMLSNLFVFPTREETFGLVLPEVSLASGALCVLNRSLQMQHEVGGGNTLYFDFGSYTNEHHCPDPDEYLKQVALIILGRMQENDSILTRTFMRKKYNYDVLYAKYYAPIMAELRLYL
jgi:hypothetical protein